MREYGVILDGCLEILRAPRGMVQVLDRDRQNLSLAAHRGFGEEFLRRFASVDVGSGGVASLVLDRGAPVGVEDVRRDPGYADDVDAADRAGFRAVYGLPLRDRDGNLHGVVSAHFPEPRAVSAAETRTLEVIGRLARHVVSPAPDEEVLEAALRDEERFLAVLSHELRSPLGVLTNAAALLRGSTGGEEVGETLRIVDRQLDRMTRLVGDVLDLTRLGRGTLEVERRRLDLLPLVDGVVRACRPACRIRGLLLDFRPAPGPLVVMGDAVRLEQVLHNLVENACKFTPAGGTVRVAVGAEAEEAVLAVEDTGVGMSAELLETLFVEERRPRRAGSGLGLGLTISRRLVALCGGRLEAESEGPGRGSTFRVRLPLAPRDET